MHTAREAGLITVAVAAMLFSSTSARAQRAVGPDCPWPASVSGPLGPDGECALQDATARLFEWLRGGGGRSAAGARGGARGLDELRFAGAPDPFSVALAGEPAADRRASVGNDGLSLLLWDETALGSGVSATSFWLDVLGVALSFDSRRTGAIGLATSPIVFLQAAVKGSNGPGVWSERVVERFDPRDRDGGRDRSGYEGTPNMTSTPEPGSVALIATGLAGLGGLGVRRRRASRH